MNPLCLVGNSFPRCMIVLDVLDECKDTNSTSIILSSLSRTYLNKILVTSRPEQNITVAFTSHSSHLSPASQKLILHEVALGTVEFDIEHYIRSSLHDIRASYTLDNSLPLEVDILCLIKLAFGLFIFAVMSIKFIEDQNYSNPIDQLTSLLNNKLTYADAPSSPHRHLDNCTHRFCPMHSQIYHAP